MAIGFRATGAAVAVASGALSFNAPASQGSTDMTFAVVVMKPYTATLTTPADWNKLGEFTNGTTASGVDTGSVKVAVFSREGVTGAFATTVTGSNVAIGQQIGYTRGGSEAWFAKMVTGVDSSHGANYSATGDANLNAANPDWIAAFTGLNADIGSISAQAITATGLTLGATNVRAQSTSTTGDDAQLQLEDCSVTSGTNSGPPSFTFTAAGSSSGGTAFVLIRVVTATITALPATNFATTDNSYQVTLTGLSDFDEWELTRISGTGAYPDEVVRGGGRQTVDNSSEVVNDYEFHYSGLAFGVPETIRYRVDLYSSGILWASLYSLVKTPMTDRASTPGFNDTTHPTVWLKNSAAPGANQPVILESFSSYGREGKILGEHNVLGRKLPVVITDVMGGIRGEFTILMYADQGWRGSFQALNNLKDLQTLFDDGGVCYFLSTWPFISGIPDFYFIVNSLSFERPSRLVDLTKPSVSNSDGPVMKVTVAFTEVERPSTLDVAVVTLTWDDVNNFYSTWTGVKNNNTSWLGVLQNG